MNLFFRNSKKSRPTKYLEELAEEGSKAFVDVQPQVEVENEVKNVCLFQESPYFIHKVSLESF